MNTLKLNELVALVHYKRDFKHVNPIFKTLNLRVDEIEGKLVISDLSRNKVATIKSKKDSGSTILTGNGFYSVTNDFKLDASFEHNKNIITYEAKIDGHGRHQKTRIKVKKDNKVFSVSISNPNFSEFGMKIKTEGSIHIWDSVYMSKDNLNIAKSTNQLYTFMNIRYPKAYLPKYDWVIPFQISINNKLDKDYNDVYFQFHTDIKEEYKIIKSVKFNGTTINQKSSLIMYLGKP